MPKYVLISDLHLGQNGGDKKGQYSVLSKPAPGSPADQAHHMRDVTERLAAKVETFAAGDKNLTLIVAGDLLDLSLAYLGDALTDLGALLGRGCPSPRRHRHRHSRSMGTIYGQAARVS